MKKTLRCEGSARDFGSSLTGSSIMWTLVMSLAIPIYAADVGSARSAHHGWAEAPRIDQEDVLWWLPSDTESVVAARGPFALPMPPQEEDQDDREWPRKKVSATDIQSAFQELSLELVEDMELSPLLRGSVVAFALQGSRHFRLPLRGFDVMDYEGCSIVVFKNNLGERARRIVRRLAKRAKQSDVAGTRVLLLHFKSEQAGWNYLVAIPRPNVLLVANSLPYLQEVLQRMGEKEPPRALPDELPEWRFLDPAVRLWGIRHYDRTQAKYDPTSPFGEDRTFGPKDDQAIGLLVALDPSNPESATITEFTGDEAQVRDAAAKRIVVAEPEEGVKYTIKVRTPKPGVLENLYTIDQVGALSYFILDVQVALGRGMYF
jgi:hypothetical protein